MSNALAIATVSATLKRLLEDALIQQSTDLVGAPLVVNALPLDRIELGEREAPQLNLFLYHVAPNSAWRNRELPSRDAHAGRVTNPPLALDLWYVLTAFGKTNFEAEILLGYAMQVLHETPVLPRSLIRAAVDYPGGTSRAAAVTALAASDLADQVEAIRITPEALNVDEISKLWTAFQAHYRPSAAYHVSVVLIEGRRSVRSPLPVLTIGDYDSRIQRDVGVFVQPNLTLQHPVLSALELPNNQPCARVGDVLRLSGHHLGEALATAIFAPARLGAALQLPLQKSAAQPFEVTIPEDSDDWPIGMYSVTVSVSGSAAGTERVSNALPLALAPRLGQVTAADALVDDEEITTIRVPCRPRVWPGQRVSLVIDDLEVAAESLVDKADTLLFPIRRASLTSGDHWVRLRVDGVESLLVERATTPPAWDATQKVTV